MPVPKRKELRVVAFWQSKCQRVGMYTEKLMEKQAITVYVATRGATWIEETGS